MAGSAKQSKKKRGRVMKLKDRGDLLASFGQRLIDIRTKKGLTPTQVSVRSGIDHGNLAKYENGREPGLIVIHLLAKGLDVDPRELIDGDFKFEIER